MTEERSIAPAQEANKFSNISMVRSRDGEITAWCGNELILGVIAITKGLDEDGNSVWSMLLEGRRVRLAEGTPAPPLYEEVTPLPNV